MAVVSGGVHRVDVVSALLMGRCDRKGASLNFNPSFFVNFVFVFCFCLNKVYPNIVKTRQRTGIGNTKAMII